MTKTKKKKKTPKAAPRKRVSGRRASSAPCESSPTSEDPVVLEPDLHMPAIPDGGYPLDDEH